MMMGSFVFFTLFLTAQLAVAPAPQTIDLSRDYLNYKIDRHADEIMRSYTKEGEALYVLDSLTRGWQNGQRATAAAFMNSPDAKGVDFNPWDWDSAYYANYYEALSKLPIETNKVLSAGSVVSDTLKQTMADFLPGAGNFAPGEKSKLSLMIGVLSPGGLMSEKADIVAFRNFVALNGDLIRNKDQIIDRVVETLRTTTDEKKIEILRSNLAKLGVVSSFENFNTVEDLLNADPSLRAKLNEENFLASLLPGGDNSHLLKEGELATDKAIAELKKQIAEMSISFAEAQKKSLEDQRKAEQEAENKRADTQARIDGLYSSVSLVSFALSMAGESTAARYVSHIGRGTLRVAQDVMKLNDALTRTLNPIALSDPTGVLMMASILDSVVKLAFGFGGGADDLKVILEALKRMEFRLSAQMTNLSEQLLDLQKMTLLGFQQIDQRLVQQSQFIIDGVASILQGQAQAQKSNIEIQRKLNELQILVRLSLSRLARIEQNQFQIQLNQRISNARRLRVTSNSVRNEKVFDSALDHLEAFRDAAVNWSADAPFTSSAIPVLSTNRKDAVYKDQIVALISNYRDLPEGSHLDFVSRLVAGLGGPVSLKAVIPNMNLWAQSTNAYLTLIAKMPELISEDHADQISEDLRAMQLAGRKIENRVRDLTHPKSGGWSQYYGPLFNEYRQAAFDVGQEIEALEMEFLKSYVRGPVESKEKLARIYSLAFTKEAQSLAPLTPEEFGIRPMPENIEARQPKAVGEAIGSIPYLSLQSIQSCDDRESDSRFQKTRIPALANIESYLPKTLGAHHVTGSGNIKVCYSVSLAKEESSQRYSEEIDKDSDRQLNDDFFPKYLGPYGPPHGTIATNGRPRLPEGATRPHLWRWVFTRTVRTYNVKVHINATFLELVDGKHKTIERSVGALSFSFNGPDEEKATARVPRKKRMGTEWEHFFSTINDGGVPFPANETRIGSLRDSIPSNADFIAALNRAVGSANNLSLTFTEPLSADSVENLSLASIQLLHGELRRHFATGLLKEESFKRIASAERMNFWRDALTAFIILGFQTDVELDANLKARTSGVLRLPSAEDVVNSIAISAVVSNSSYPYAQNIKNYTTDLWNELDQRTLRDGYSGQVHYSITSLLEAIEQARKSLKDR